MISWLTSSVTGPIASGLAVVLAFALAIVWLVDSARISDLQNQINNPKTGYEARLVAAQTDSATCRGVVADQNRALDNLAKMQADKMEKAAQAIDAANAALEQAGKKVAAILAAKPGPDKCIAADALILGSVK